MSTRRDWNRACVETLQQRLQVLHNEATHTEHRHWNDAMEIPDNGSLSTYRLRLAQTARNHAEMAHTAEAMLMHAADLLDQLERVDMSYHRADFAPE